MMRQSLIALSLVLAAAACAPTGGARLGPDGLPLPKLYRISARDEPAIQQRMLENINVLRQAVAAPPLALDPALNVAAATHSRDMSRQNRPWHFGSDGSSPLDRIQRAGYTGPLIGENISETYETELETLGAWMELPDTRSVMLDPAARSLGFSFYQDANGKIWWTLITGG